MGEYGQKGQQMCQSGRVNQTEFGSRLRTTVWKTCHLLIAVIGQEMVGVRLMHIANMFMQKAQQVSLRIHQLHLLSRPQKEELMNRDAERRSCL
jgi:hypothetical protein